MHRRLVLTSLALATTAIAANRAFAQDAAKPDAMSSDAMASDNMASDAMAGGMMPMGEAEMTHATETQKVGSLSLATSRVALQKASNADVKKFAQFETDEQETVADILTSMKMDMSEAQGALKVPTDEEVQAMLDDEGKAMLEKMQGLSGDEFDAQYVMAQTDGHNKLLKIQEDYLKVGKNREHLDVAKLARGMIKEHLVHLADLKSMMG